MDSRLWSDLNWVFIIGLIIASGLFAYLGDILGTRIGKKRISILGLRPRHTGSIITAITGITIALVVLGSLAITSDTVRTILFSMKFLQRQINQLTSDLQDSRDEAELTYLRLVETQGKLLDQEGKLRSVGEDLSSNISQLQRTQGELNELKSEKQQLEQIIADLGMEAEQLKKGLTEVRGGRIIVFADELLAQHSVDEGTAGDVVSSIIDKLVQRAEFIVAVRLGIDPEKISIQLDPEQRESVIKDTVDSNTRRFVRLLAGSNILAGEPVKVTFEVKESLPVYPEATELWSEVIPAPPSESEAEALLHALLRKVNSRAVGDGVLPDPVSGTVGILDASDFFEAVSKLSQAHNSVKIRIFTREEVFTEGPVRIKIDILQD